MKRIICIIGVVALLFSLTGCSFIHELSVKKYVPKGFISSEEHIKKGEFQDYTDFCIYKYDSAEAFRNSKYYASVEQGDIIKIKDYFSDIKMWMEIAGRTEEYTFDGECVSVGDYVHIETKQGMPNGKEGEIYGKYDDYSVYLFDKETYTLYYVHNNL